MQLSRRQALSLTMALPLGAGALRADEKLAGKACRSVHLAYTAPEGDLFYNEVSVDQSAPGTYFCSSGFRQGYFGVQELWNGKRLAIFSVWDPGAQDNPIAVPEEKRVKLLAKGDKVRVGRFGGEGTGGQSCLDHPWKKTETLRFQLAAKREGAGRIAYTGWFSAPGLEGWQLVASFSTLSAKGLLSGYYSFVEDFRRDGESLKKARRAHYGNGWVRTVAGAWEPVKKARFTADGNPSMAIDAGLDKDRWFLATGGDTENKTTKLRQEMPDNTPATKPPEGLPKDPFAVDLRG
ncbi:MAG: DUF3472 domain-containing protein [Gemmataceae bacterium]